MTQYTSGPENQGERTAESKLPKGWSPFKDLHYSENAVHLRDMQNGRILGLRYRITRRDIRTEDDLFVLGHSQFEFEKWDYKVPGGPTARAFLRFGLSDRLMLWLSPSQSMDNLHIFGQPFTVTDSVTLRTVRLAAYLMQEIDRNVLPDIVSALDKYRLLPDSAQYCVLSSQQSRQDSFLRD